MGQMKWVYSLAQDGRLKEYMEVYYKNLANNSVGFTYADKWLDMKRAHAVLKLLKQADEKYQIHIDEQAERLADQASEQQYLEQ
tara:strand:+ start:1912 stop:2163 length:252 start_codon:yes stop_codon:yes gene_type:complete